MKQINKYICDHFENDKFSILEHVENSKFSISEKLHINKDTTNYYNYHPLLVLTEYESHIYLYYIF